MIELAKESGARQAATLRLRVGIYSGPVVAGIIGRRKFIYDFWGDTVNLASRMESTGVPDAIQVTRPIYEWLKDRYAFEARGPVEVEGKGSIGIWVCRGKA